MQNATGNSGLLDTICILVGGAVVGLGLFFMWRSILGDRAGKKPGCRRCPHCWYDMAGVPGLLCPECGKAAKDEEGLKRRRRRWRAAMVWAFVVLLGIVGAMTPRMSRQGLVGAVPTTVLVWWAPVNGGPGVQSRRSQVLQVRPTGSKFATGSGSPSLSFPDLPWSEQLEVEAWRRVTGGDAWQWQSRVLIERWLNRHKTSIDKLVVVPKRWNAGEPIPVLIMPPVATWEMTDVHIGGPRPVAVGRASSANSFKQVITLDAKAVTHGQGATFGKLRILEPLEIELQGARAPVGEFDVTIDALAPGEPLLDGLDDAETNALVRAVLSPRVVVDAWGKDVVVGNRSEAPIWKNVDFAIAMTLRVMQGERCLGTCETTVNWDYAVWKDYTEAPMVWEEGGLEALLAEPEKATIRVTGDRGPAEKQFIDWPFGRRAAAWTGTFEVPVRVEAMRTREK